MSRPVSTETYMQYHRRRLVINIGGAKIWVTNIGGGAKTLGKFIFRQKIFKKFPSILSKISDDTPFIQNVLRFLCIVVSVSAFSSDYWGGQKRGFAPPILIIGGARARAAPPESTPMRSIHKLKHTHYSRGLYLTGSGKPLRGSHGSKSLERPGNISTGKVFGQRWPSNQQRFR